MFLNTISACFETKIDKIFDNSQKSVAESKDTKGFRYVLSSLKFYEVFKKIKKLRITFEFTEEINITSNINFFSIRPAITYLKEDYSLRYMQKKCINKLPITNFFNDGQNSFFIFGKKLKNKNYNEPLDYDINVNFNPEGLLNNSSSNFIYSRKKIDHNDSFFGSSSFLIEAHVFQELPFFNTILYRFCKEFINVTIDIFFKIEKVYKNDFYFEFFCYDKEKNIFLEKQEIKKDKINNWKNVLINFKKIEKGSFFGIRVLRKDSKLDLVKNFAKDIYFNDYDEFDKTFKNTNKDKEKQANLDKVNNIFKNKKGDKREDLAELKNENFFKTLKIAQNIHFDKFKFFKIKIGNISIKNKENLDINFIKNNLKYSFLVRKGLKKSNIEKYDLFIKFDIKNELSKMIKNIFLIKKNKIIDSIYFVDNLIKNLDLFKKKKKEIFKLYIILNNGKIFNEEYLNFIIHRKNVILLNDIDKYFKKRKKIN